MTEQFKREERYLVIKRSRIYADAPDAGPILEKKLRAAIRDCAGENALVNCVVVEHDWPEHETVWKMIQARCEGRTLARPVGAVAYTREELRILMGYIIDLAQQSAEVSGSNGALDTLVNIASSVRDRAPSRVASPAADQAVPGAIRDVAMVEELLDDNCARVRWLFNPISEGQLLLWDHGDNPARQAAELWPLEAFREAVSPKGECAHATWEFELHGRCCPCGKMMRDFGD